MVVGVYVHLRCNCVLRISSNNKIFFLVLFFYYHIMFVKIMDTVIF